METNVGIHDLEDLLLAVGGVTAFDSTHARLGVGDGNGSVPTAAVTDTTLTAPTNKLFKNVSSATRTGNVITFVATFATTDANFAWNEWGIDNGNGGGPGHLFNHVGVSLGTKVNTATWIFTATITQS